MSRIESVGVIGAGVIGSGWIARFLLNGIDVAVYDPSKDAPNNVNKVIQNAERAYAQLLVSDLPKKGTLAFENTRLQRLLNLPISLSKLSRKDCQKNNRFMMRLN